MTTIVYSSSDDSAPQLSGTAGSLIAVLDACLVTGYGAKAAIGWTKPFTGANVAVFRQPVGTSNGMYLRIDDSTSSTPSSATVRGYETMSGISTGTGEFPLVGQTANVYWVRSDGPTAAVRPWVLIGNERGFYLWTTVTTDTATYANTRLYYFVELNPLNPSDIWGTVLYGDSTPQSTTNSHLSIVPQPYARQTSVTQYRYAARPFGGVGGSVGINLLDYSFFNSTGTVPYGNDTNLANCMQYPNGPDTGLYLAPAHTVEVSAPNSLRGPLRGLWAPLHGRPLANGDTFSGTGSLAGRTFIALSLNSQSQTGQVFIETSNTW